MPLPRPLLQLCALLLIVFAATAAHADAAAYGPNEVTIIITQTPKSKTRSAQSTVCRASGGVLLPMVTDVVYQKTLSQMTSFGFNYTIGYIGASTMLSPETCTTKEATLDCTWSWDEGRYAGKDNALEFYKGNRNVRDLPGAVMLSPVVANYWGAHADAKNYPGSLMQRYGIVERQGGVLGWVDSSATAWSYPYALLSQVYTFCAIDLNPSASPTPSTTTTTTTTTTKPSVDKSAGLSVGAIVGIAAGCAVVVGVIIALVACLSCSCRCCCSAGSTAVAESAYAHESCCAASQRGDMSRANSCRSCHSGYGDFSNRSFHDGAAGKDGYSRRSSFHGGAGAAEASVWQNDCEMMSVVGSHYSRAASQMMMQPQPPTLMYGNRQVVEAPMPVSVYTTEQSGAEMQRRCSNVNPAMCDMSDTDDVHAVAAVSV